MHIKENSLSTGYLSSLTLTWPKEVMGETGQIVRDTPKENTGERKKLHSSQDEDSSQDDRPYAMAIFDKHF